MSPKTLRNRARRTNASRHVAIIDENGSQAVVRHFTLVAPGMSPPDVERCVRVLVRKVTDAVGETAARVKTFGAIRSFQVVASKRFLDEVQKLPEIASTITPKKDVIISPVRSRRVQTPMALR